jgi:hypothetical protein
VCILLWLFKCPFCLNVWLQSWARYLDIDMILTRSWQYQDF